MYTPDSYIIVFIEFPESENSGAVKKIDRNLICLISRNGLFPLFSIALSHEDDFLTRTEIAREGRE